MKAETRHALDGYYSRIAQLNNVNSASLMFSVEPSIQQKLEEKMQQSSSFLSRINMIGVDELEGEKIGMGVSGPIASTTPRDGVAVRQPVNVMTLDSQKYHCDPINFDLFVLYATLDKWAKFRDFQTRLNNVILKRQALDRIMIGFNGIRHAPQSDPATNPLRQDVQKGWLQQYREIAPQRILSEGKTPGKIVIGKSASADYRNLDSLVYDATNSLIEEWHQDRTDLVAICGRRLLVDKYFPMVDREEKPTEVLAAEIVMSKKQIGGHPAARVPYFPAGSIFITPLSNLSIYWQTGGRRRHIKEEPERNRIVDYQSSNDAYVVEDFEAGCLIENIEIEYPEDEQEAGG